MCFLKILLLSVFFLILYQDCKDRKVFWFLYPTIGILTFILQIKVVPFYSVLVNTGFNLIFVFILLLVSYLYAKFRLKKNLLKEVFGLGDVLFFLFITFSFSIVSFYILFIFSLFLSLLLHFILKHRQIEKTVPLAGYMSLFFGTVYAISFFYKCNFLYAY
jgi:hypothetical protein